MSRRMVHASASSLNRIGSESWTSSNAFLSASSTLRYFEQQLENEILNVAQFAVWVEVRFSVGCVASERISEVSQGLRMELLSEASSME